MSLYLYTRTVPLLLVFDRAPIATIVPSAETLRLVPLSSPLTFPSMSEPSLFHVVPYVVNRFDVGVGIKNVPSVITLLLNELKLPNPTFNDAVVLAAL